MPIVKRFCGTQVETLSPVSAPGVPFPSGSAAMVPAFVSFAGAVYDCRAPGLYRFWSGNGVPIYSRIVAWLDGKVGVPKAIDLYAWAVL